MIKEEFDGKTHINLYSKGHTKIGRMLSNFYHAPIKISKEGNFQSVEGYYYWLLAKEDHPKRNKLKRLYGFEAKKLGRELRKKDYKKKRRKESFREQILKAIYIKIRTHPGIERRLINSTLPLEHYYVYNSKIVEPPGLNWYTSGIEQMRKKLKEKILIREREGNLFETGGDFVYAHCVSSDGEMGAGIASKFVDNYPNIQKSVEEYGVGQAAPHEEKDDKVYNLITKEKYFQKPTYESIRKSLEDIKSKMLENEEVKLAIPRIASGLDGKNWNKVWKILKSVFKDTDIKVLVRYIK